MSAMDSVGPSLHRAISLHGVGAVMSVLEARSRAPTLKIEHASHGLFMKAFFPKRLNENDGRRHETCNRGSCVKQFDIGTGDIDAGVSENEDVATLSTSEGNNALEESIIDNNSVAGGSSSGCEKDIVAEKTVMETISKQAAEIDEMASRFAQLEKNLEGVDTDAGGRSLHSRIEDVILATVMPKIEDHHDKFDKVFNMFEALTGQIKDLVLLVKPSGPDIDSRSSNGRKQTKRKT